MTTLVEEDGDGRKNKLSAALTSVCAFSHKTCGQIEFEIRFFCGALIRREPYFDES